MELKESNGLTWYEWVDNGIRMIELTGEGFLSDEETASFKAEFLGSDDWKKKASLPKPFEILIQEDCNVYAPKEASVFDMFEDGKSREEDLADRLFLVFRRRAISPELCEAARAGLRGAAQPSKNRGVAGGKVDPKLFGRSPDRIIPIGDGTRARYIKADGVLSKTVEANTTMGGIAGYYPPTARNPYCRATAYTRDNWDVFKESWPFLQEMSNLFEKLAPTRYANQMRFVEEQNIDEYGWCVPGTPFSTITVNKNFQTACHQDAGDLKSGLENFAVLEGGEDEYTGGETVFPKFRVAFNARTGDWVGMDVAHHWHGNMKMVSAVEGKDDWERISIVCYVREDLQGCGTQETERAKYLSWKENRRNSRQQYEHNRELDRKEQEAEALLMNEFGES